jgi:acyl-CoA thioesterase
MENIMRFFKNDRFAETAGIELLEVSEGKARAKMVIKEEHLNGVNTVHGGALFTLADLAFALAANSHGTVAVAVNVNISYFKAVSSGTLYAEAKEVSLNSKLGNYTVNITDENGQLIALFQGMAYRKKDPIITG